MSSLAKTDLIADDEPVEAPIVDADFAEIEARAVAHFFGRCESPASTAAAFAAGGAEAIAKALADRGYRRVSNKHRLVSRIDRADWKEALAAHLRKSVAELYIVSEVGAPGRRRGFAPNWVVSDEVSPRWASYFRRVLSADVVEVPQEAFRSIPSSDYDPIGYVAPVEAANA